MVQSSRDKSKERNPFEISEASEKQQEYIKAIQDTLQVYYVGKTKKDVWKFINQYSTELDKETARLHKPRKANIYHDANTLMRDILKEVQETKEEVYIASYGIYADISHDKDWAPEYEKSDARLLLDTIARNNVPHKIIIGEQIRKECHAGCEHCKRLNEETKQRTLNTKNTIGLNLITVPSTHLKYYRVGDRVWTGGINLGASDWIDLSIEILDEHIKKDLKDLFETMWKIHTGEEVENGE